MVGVYVKESILLVAVVQKFVQKKLCLNSEVITDTHLLRVTVISSHCHIITLTHLLRVTVISPHCHIITLFTALNELGKARQGNGMVT